ncbi:ABC transporter permease [Sediminispirochaeta smaragdinae]|nr:iron ABC transporter permease [Sediminispirochaeta smaragdinae]
MHYNKTRLFNYLRNPPNLITIVSIIVLLYLVVIPLWEILSNTFQLQFRDAMKTGLSEGSFTLRYWIQTFASTISKAMFYKPLVNSLLISLNVSVFGILIGGILAWLVTRTDLPLKNFFSFILVVAYMVPSWCKALSWQIIFKNDRIGGYPGMFQSIFKIAPPNWISYGFFPIVITLSLHYFVFSFLLISAALSSIGGDLEEMAEITGAKRSTILRRITFPLVMPAILSSFILTFSKAIGSFGAPAFLGLKVNYYTLSTMIYANIRNRMTTQAFTLSIVLILVASFTVYLNQKAIGKRKSFTTIGGKSTRRNFIKLKKFKPLVTIAVFLFVVLGVIMPLVVLVLQSLMLKKGVYSPSNLTLHFWIGESNPAIADGEAGIFHNPRIWLALVNTMKLVIITSLIATVVGLLLGYIISRGRKKISGRFIEQISFTPMLIPSIALSTIYLSMFSKQQLFLPVLYGTFSLLVLISIVKYLPFAVRSGTSSMMQINSELEEAAKIEGTPWHKIFSRLILPLAKGGIFSAFLLIFISGMKELALIMLLVTPETSTLTTLTYSYTESGFEQFSDAITTLIIFIIIVVNFIARKVSKADISQGIGG